MSFIPNTDADRARMLQAVGVGSVADLFRDVPAEHRFPTLDLPPALSEQEVLRELDGLAAAQRGLRPHAAVSSAPGAYHHFIPSVVDFVISRSEFYTAYTPYQPEISQGTLQAIFEYQSMIARLTGMEVSNASHYDGATSTAEAVIMALNVAQRQRKRVVLSAGVHPQYREVVRTYTQGMGLEVQGDDNRSGRSPSSPALCDPATACVVVQSPDFFGRIVPPAALTGACRGECTPAARSWSSWPTRYPSACSCRPGSAAPTSWWEKGRPWATRWPSAGRTSASLPSAGTRSGGPADASPGRRWTGRATAATCSR